jgi:hypothetical protein
VLSVFNGTSDLVVFMAESWARMSTGHKSESNKKSKTEEILHCPDG